MVYFKLVRIFMISTTLCILPTNAQAADLMGCMKTIICNVTEYVNKCCTESFQGETEMWDKQGMVSCLKTVMFQQAETCMNGPSPGSEEDREVEIIKYRTGSRRGGRLSSMKKEDSSPMSRRHSRQRSRFEKYGYSNMMQNEDCKLLKDKQPSGAEECSEWSEAANRCVQGIPLVQFICQSGSSFFGGSGGGSFGMSGQRPFGGMGQGSMSLFGGMGQGSMKPFGGMGQGNMRPFGGMGQGIMNPFGGMGQGAMRPFGGMGQGVMNPFGGMGQGVMRPFGGIGQGSLGSFGGMGNGGFGGIDKPIFGKPEEGKFDPPTVDDEWEYGVVVE